MARKRNRGGDSLELLLDTICNMFGGVLFLAILIAVLIRTTKDVREESDPEPPQTVTATAAQYHDAVRELNDRLQARDSKRAAVRRQREQGKRLIDPAVAATLERTTQLEDEQREIETQTVETAEALAEARERTEGVSAELVALEKSLAESERELAEARQTLAEEVESRTLASRLPRLRQSLKTEAGLIVRFGRLYTWHKYDRFGRRVGVNLDELILVSVAGEVPTVTPSPAAGVPLDEAHRDDAVRKLAVFDPDDYYVAVVVYDDSFAEFTLLKRLLVEQGIEYRLMPSLPGEDIRDYGGRGGLVQ